eukprot:6122153-Alexandrium_andersonii.AAC.1
MQHACDMRAVGARLSLQPAVPAGSGSFEPFRIVSFAPSPGGATATRTIRKAPPALCFLRFPDFPLYHRGVYHPPDTTPPLAPPAGAG